MKKTDHASNEKNSLQAMKKKQFADNTLIKYRIINYQVSVFLTLSLSQ
jgi:hypothetical protein